MSERHRALTRISTLRAAMLVGLVVLAAGTTTARAEDEPLPETPSVAREAVLAYVAEHGVSAAAANRRLTLQDDAAPVTDDLADAVGPGYAGMWYDAGDGGRLKVGVAAPSGGAIAAAGPLLVRHRLQAHVDVVRVRSDLRALMAAQRRINRELEPLMRMGQVSTSIDPQDNAVVIDTATMLGPSQRGQLRQIAASSPVTVSVRRTDSPSLLIDTTACALRAGDWSSSQLFCDPALRGGAMIAGGDFACSAGFTVIGSFYALLTAGHCGADNPAKVWQTRFADGSRHEIGPTYSSVFGSRGDYGLIAINRPRGWDLGFTGVWVDGVPSFTSRDAFYTISAARSPVKGTTVCGSSAFPLPDGRHSACGSVTAVNVTIGYRDGPIVHGLYAANACTGVGGSSGGPYYKSHIGYGIQSGSDRRNPCKVFFQDLPRALRATHTRLLP